MPEPVRKMLTALETFAKENSGVLVLGFAAAGGWTVSLTQGADETLGEALVLEDALLQVAEKVGVELPGGEPITPDEAANLFAAYTGGEVNPDLLSSVTPKLEAIARRELIP